MSVTEFPSHRIIRSVPPFKPKLVGDDLAEIGNPEFTLSEALRELRSVALKVAAIKSGDQGEADCIYEVLRAFRGPDWEKMLFCEDGA